MDGSCLCQTAPRKVVRPARRLRPGAAVWAYLLVN